MKHGLRVGIDGVEVAQMPRARGRPPAVVRDFLHLVATLNGRKGAGAVDAFLRLQTRDAEAREELLFHIDGRYSRQKRQFIAFNNRLVRQELRARRPRRLLVLLPFCVQQRLCPHHIAWRIENCRRCGRCPVGPLRDLCERYDVELRMTLRSRFAPQFVKETRPDLVLAVACEHELVAGILRVAPCPCYGIMNRRPEGFCRNTQVDVAEVARALRRFLGPPS